MRSKTFKVVLSLGMDAAILVGSPTWWFINLVKTDERETRTKRLTYWSYFCLLLELSTATMLSFVNPGAFCYLAKCLITYYGYSRIVEIYIAFAKDLRDRSNGEYPTTNLRKIDRIRMAWFSFIGLIINYSLVFWSQPIFEIQTSCKVPVSRYFEILYYSCISICTVGYGEIAPATTAARFLTMIEVLSGAIMISTIIGMYLSAPNDEPINRNNTTPW